MYYGLATVVPPAYGCSALPLVAESREEVAGLLVVAGKE